MCQDGKAVAFWAGMGKFAKNHERKVLSWNVARRSVPFWDNSGGTEFPTGFSELAAIDSLIRNLEKAFRFGTPRVTEEDKQEPENS
jgi:hypothetical protein